MKKKLDSYHCWQHVHHLPFSEIAESPSPLSSVSTKSVGKTSKINCTTFLRAWQLLLKEAPALPPSLKRSPAGKISLSAPSLRGLHTLLNFTCLNESRLVEYSHQVWTLTQFFFSKDFFPFISSEWNFLISLSLNSMTFSYTTGFFHRFSLNSRWSKLKDFLLNSSKF